MIKNLKKKVPLRDDCESSGDRNCESSGDRNAGKKIKRKTRLRTRARARRKWAIENGRADVYIGDVCAHSL